MSKTKRRGFKLVELKGGGDCDIAYTTEKKDNKSIRDVTFGRRMKAYTPNNKRGKFAVDISNGDGNGGGYKVGVSRLGKLVAKNANRSKKKSVRQGVKQEIKKVISGL